MAESITVFLAGAQCPFTCLFCDLWRWTIPGATRVGTLPGQLRQALDQVPGESLHQIKLYNASNFFDPRAVPPQDHPALLALLAGFDRVVVENHPRLTDASCVEFAAALPGRLQLAMGLETVHPEAFERLNKGMALADFDRAAALCVGSGLGVRAFVLVGVPFVPRRQAADWVVASARYAFERGAEHVALIPVRGGNGAMDALERAGHFAPPTLGLLEEAFDRCLELRAGVVTVDLWDLDALAGSGPVAEGRRRRLERLNLEGIPP